MKVLFISNFDTANPGLRSGVPFYIAKGLQAAGVDFRVLQVSDRRNLFERLQSRVKQWLCKTGIWKGFYDAGYSIATAKSYRRCWQGFDFSVFDKVLSISPRTVAFLPEGIQPVLWIDNSLATFHLYPEMQGICPQSLEEGFCVERIAFERASKIVTASAWLAGKINSQYPFVSSKTCVVPRGANLPAWPLPEVVEGFRENRLKTGALQLVHVVSGGWAHDRKGSRLVCEVYRLLKHKIEVHLTIIGAVPPSQKQGLEKEGITCTGRLDKEAPGGMEKWQETMGRAHFLFVPSRADGFGIVYAEAAALGVPSLALSVMGVTEAVKQGITGWLLPPETSATGWASFILEKWQDREMYARLCLTTRNRAVEHFQWQQNLRRVLEEVCG